MKSRLNILMMASAAALILLGGCSSDDDGAVETDVLSSELGFDDAQSRLLVIMNRELRGDEVLHTRIRPLSEGAELDCASMHSEIPTLTELRSSAEFVGPVVEESMFENPTTPDALLNNSEEDFQRRQNNTYFVDVCVMDGTNVAHRARYDLRQALDRIGSGKGDEFDDGVRIASNQAYATACIQAMGDIPFWERLDAEGTGELVYNVEEGSTLARAILEYVNTSESFELDSHLDTRAVSAIVESRPFDSLAQIDEVEFLGPVSFRRIASRVDELGLVEPVEVFDWNTVDCTEVGTPIPSTVDGEPVDDWVDQCDNPQTIYSHCEPDARTGANGPRVAHARNAQGTHWVLLCRKSHKAQGRYEDMAMIGHNPFTGQTCFFQNQLPPGETPQPSNDGTKIPHPADNVSSEASPQVWNDLWGGIEGGIGPEGGIQCQGCHSTDPFVHTPWIDQAVDENGDPVVPKMGHNPDFVEGYSGPYSLIDAQDQGWNEPKHLVSEEASSCTSCHRIGLDQWTASNSISSTRNENGGSVFRGAPWLDRMDHSDTSWDQLLTPRGLLFENYYWMPTNAHEVLNEELWPESEYAQALDFIRMCGANPDDEACIWESLPKVPGDPNEIPEVEETGIELAEKSLAILGAPHTTQSGEEVEATRRCGECHATSKFGFRDWLERTQEAMAVGLDPTQNVEELTQEEALQIVNFMRRDTEESVFAAYKAGVLVAGAQFPYFKRVFQKAYGSAWGIPYGAFLARVSMPKGSHPPLSAEEFSTIYKWFAHEELAHLDELLIEVPPPATCEEVRDRYNLNSPSPWLANHLDDMQFDGWGARNEEAGINMFGCTSNDPLSCFQDSKYPELESWNTTDVEGAKLISVAEFEFSTSFWMRTSADGRFVGNGGAGGENHRATITDLLTGTNIGVRGSYDPGFFPNNGGFIMQGGGAGLCDQSVLTNPDAIEGGIDFTEPGCSNAEGINLYQHVAVDLNGGDYFIINSEFTSDAGNANSDPRAPFYEGSTMKFSPLVFDGTDWRQKPAVVVNSPYEGDSVLSPSGKMVISRFAGPDGDALGHMIRRVIASPNTESYSIDISTPVQFLCEPGAKSNISFDERFSVTHVYENGTANIYLTDILTGETHQITDMPEGTKALFPHFRSDGWIYILAKGEKDSAFASDAALRLMQNL